MSDDVVTVLESREHRPWPHVRFFVCQTLGSQAPFMVRTRAFDRQGKGLTSWNECRVGSRKDADKKHHAITEAKRRAGWKDVEPVEPVTTVPSKLFDAMDESPKGHNLAVWFKDVNGIGHRVRLGVEYKANRDPENRDIVQVIDDNGETVHCFDERFDKIVTLDATGSPFKLWTPEPGEKIRVINGQEPMTHFVHVVEDSSVDCVGSDCPICKMGIKRHEAKK